LGRAFEGRKFKRPLRGGPKNSFLEGSLVEG
jgi:hypothetical protein